MGKHGPVAGRQQRTVGLGRRVWVKEVEGPGLLNVLLSCPCRSLGQKRQTMGSITAFGWCITMVSRVWVLQHSETPSTSSGPERAWL